MAAVYEIHVSRDARPPAEDAAEHFIRAAANVTHGPFRVALSGGSTPRTLYERLASSAYSGRVAWRQVEFYFGDERCVPPDHAESNFRLADDTLFRPLGIHPSQVFRMEGETDQPDQAARRYEDLIRRQFASPSPAWPRFELILLGLGEDGHTASLFPDSPALHETTRAVVASHSPRGVPHRLTFTAPLINRAQEVLFLVAGAGKASAVRAVLEDQQADVDRYPAKMIRPIDGRIVWYLDQAAASGLQLNDQTLNR